MTQTETAEYRYEARGMVDDVTTCEICGKPELKGTVRLVIIGPDGDEDGEVFAGVTCAARRAGRKAAEIRTEAVRADRARYEAVRDTYNAWRDSETTWIVAAWTAALGRSPSPRLVLEFRDTDGHRAAHAAWLAAHPRPVAPWDRP
jgi:hypothetical protein